MTDRLKTISPIDPYPDPRRGHQSSTPAHLAADWGNLDNLKRFIYEGADLFATRTISAAERRDGKGATVAEAVLYTSYNDFNSGKSYSKLLNDKRDCADFLRSHLIMVEEELDRDLHSGVRPLDQYLDAQGNATRRLLTIAGAGLLPRLFDPARWQGRTHEAQEMLTQIMIALPCHYAQKYADGHLAERLEQPLQEYPDTKGNRELIDALEYAVRPKASLRPAPAQTNTPSADGREADGHWIARLNDRRQQSNARFKQQVDDFYGQPTGTITDARALLGKKLKAIGERIKGDDGKSNSR